MQQSAEMSKCALTIIVLLIFLESSSSANIFFMSLQSTPSAHIWNEALVEGLLNEEHSVTLLTHNDANKMEHQNLTVMIIEGVRNVTLKRFDFSKLIKYGSLDNILWQWKIVVDLCIHDFKSPVFKKAIFEHPKNYFDLLIIDINNAQCHYPIIDLFGLPPTISVSPFGLAPFLGEIIGHKTPSYIPFYTLDYTDKMTFIQRFYNVFIQTTEKLIRWYYMRKINLLAKEYFGPGIRKLEDIESNISMVLANSDPFFDYPEPYGPNIISVGGLHVKKPKPLNRDLQEIFNRSTIVIYFSLGTNILNVNMDNTITKHFLEAFARINHTILWKLDNVTHLNLPENVFTRSWFPQNDILAQPKLKIFITHCGRLGTQEAIRYGVPVIGLPVALDTPYVAGKIRSVHAGIILDTANLNADIIHQAIVEILNNKKYSENMMRISKRYMNQPQEPLEKALDWIQYILKVGHSDHLSTANRYMTWYQENDLDIFLIVYVVISLIFYLVLKVLNWCVFLMVSFLCKPPSEKLGKLKII